MNNHPRYPEAVVLETFPAVLSRTIERSGMSLEHLQRRVAARGAKVSLSTLSYWRRGRTRPERPDSLHAVRVIEEVLGLPNGYLLTLLGPRKPRGRWVSRGGLVRPHEALWDTTTGLAPILAELGEPEPTALTYLSVQDQHFLDHQRRDYHTRVRIVVRSEVDWLGSCVVLHQAERTDRALPVVVAGTGCLIGRTRTQPASRFTVAEILFDRRLKAGDTAMFEYEVRWFGVGRSTRYTRATRRATREYLLQVNFHPTALPARCHEYAQTTVRAPETVLGKLEIGTLAGVHAIMRDSDAAIRGIRWDW
ncbi:hypothetical protein [Actinokineospora sp.]|uniref:hypothetical protein n=1 Tax=Actinokineospora sp. TaxID=1872133 RepID=UPI004038116D